MAGTTDAKFIKAEAAKRGMPAPREGKAVLAEPALHGDAVVTADRIPTVELCADDAAHILRRNAGRFLDRVEGQKDAGLAFLKEGQHLPEFSWSAQLNPDVLSWLISKRCSVAVKVKK